MLDPICWNLSLFVQYTMLKLWHHMLMMAFISWESWYIKKDVLMWKYPINNIYLKAENDNKNYNKTFSVWNLRRPREIWKEKNNFRLARSLKISKFYCCFFFFLFMDKLANGERLFFFSILIPFWMKFRDEINITMLCL